MAVQSGIIVHTRKLSTAYATIAELSAMRGKLEELRDRMRHDREFEDAMRSIRELQSLMDHIQAQSWNIVNNR